ncbi:hypothetical protein Bbelb_077460 [Branchiostoma belcheri]|nr:hypothetical protein Bbelb_077460 [Branchiostoma belcheri]
MFTMQQRLLTTTSSTAVEIVGSRLPNTTRYPDRSSSSVVTAREKMERSSKRNLMDNYEERNEGFSLDEATRVAADHTTWKDILLPQVLPDRSNTSNPLFYFLLALPALMRRRSK